MPADAFTNIDAGGQPIPQVMGGYLEKGAKAVIDMQDELRNQALKLFSGFPYAAGQAARRRAEAAAREAEARQARAPRASRARSKK